MTSLKELKAIVKSIAISSQAQLNISQMLTDYKEITGEELPFKTFGFCTAEVFLKQALQDVLIVIGDGKSASIIPIVDDRTYHLAKLVEEQKSFRSKKRANKFKNNCNKKPTNVKNQRKKPNAVVTGSERNSCESNSEKNVKKNFKKDVVKHKKNLSSETNVIDNVRKCDDDTKSKESKEEAHVNQKEHIIEKADKASVLTLNIKETNSEKETNNEMDKKNGNEEEVKIDKTSKDDSEANVKPHTRKSSSEVTFSDNIEYNNESETENASSYFDSLDWPYGTFDQIYRFHMTLMKEEKKKTPRSREEIYYEIFGTHEFETPKYKTPKHKTENGFNTKPKSSYMSSADFLRVKIFKDLCAARREQKNSNDSKESEEAIPEFACNQRIDTLDFPDDTAKFGTKIKPCPQQQNINGEEVKIDETTKDDSEANVKPQKPKSHLKVTFSDNIEYNNECETENCGGYSRSVLIDEICRYQNALKENSNETPKERADICDKIFGPIIETPKYEFNTTPKSLHMSAEDFASEQKNSKVSKESEEAIPEFACNKLVYILDFPDNTAKFGTKIKTFRRYNRVNSVFAIYVTEVHNPYRFWFHMSEKQELDDLMYKLQRYYSRIRSVIEYDVIRELVQPGQLCAAPYSNAWHRAEILTTICDEKVKVFFMDYGTVDNVSVKDLKYLRMEFVEQPAFAYRGSLAELNPDGLHWSTQSSLFFLKLVTDRRLNARVCEFDMENQVYYLSLHGVYPNFETITLSLVHNNFVSKSWEWFYEEMTCCARDRHVREDYPTFEMLEKAEYPTLDEIITMEKHNIDYETITDSMIYSRTIKRNVLPFQLLPNNPFRYDIEEQIREDQEKEREKEKQREREREKGKPVEARLSWIR